MASHIFRNIYFCLAYLTVERCVPCCFQTTRPENDSFTQAYVEFFNTLDRNSGLQPPSQTENDSYFLNVTTVNETIPVLDPTGSTPNFLINKTVKDEPSVVRKLDGIENKCKTYSTCEMNKDMGIPVCYCDDICGLLNDCCFDYENDVSNWSMYQEVLAKLPYIKCGISHFGTAVITRNYIGSFIISECPVDYPTNEVSLKCKDENGIFPVTAEDGITYRNAYCAYCHNITEYKVWTLAVSYESQSSCDWKVMASLNITNFNSRFKFIQDNNCPYRFQPSEETHARFCLISKEENKTDSCNSFISPVMWKSTRDVYRNLYCIDEDEVNQKGEDIQIAYSCIYPKITQDIYGFGSVDTVALFNIRPVIELFGEKICRVDKVYDHFSDTCKDECKEELGETCDIELVKNLRFDSEYEFTGHGDFCSIRFANLFIDRLVYFIYFSLPREKYNLRFLTFKKRRTCTERKDDSNIQCCGFQVKLHYTVDDKVSIKQFTKFITDVARMGWEYTEVHPEQTITVRHLTGLVTSIEDICNVSHTAVYTSQILLHHQYHFHEVLNSFDVNRSKNAVPTLSNITVQYNSSDISDISVIKWELNYKSENKTSFFFTNETSSWSVSIIFTYTTMGVSDIMLAITMLIYKIIGLSQSGPGTISLNMMGTLLMAQLLFVIGDGVNDFQTICLIIGAISHYTWLCSFSWINVFLCQVLYMMRKLYSEPGAAVANGQLSKKIYCLGYVMPIGIVLPSITLDIFSEVDIRYAGDVCFPTGFPGNLIFFTIPVMISIIVNFIALVISSCSLSRYNDANMLSDSSRKIRSHVPIYLKLTLLCACPWIIGMLADVFRSDILSYIFVILVGSHGIFVSISFLSTKSVRKKLWKKLKENKDNNALHS